jgi:hypothetical protein
MTDRDREQEQLLRELNMLSRLNWPCPPPTERCLCCGSRLSPKRQQALARLFAPKRHGATSLSVDRKVATEGEMVYVWGLPTRDHSLCRN